MRDGDNGLPKASHLVKLEIFASSLIELWMEVLISVAVRGAMRPHGVAQTHGWTSIWSKVHGSVETCFVDHWQSSIDLFEEDLVPGEISVSILGLSTECVRRSQFVSGLWSWQWLLQAESNHVEGEVIIKGAGTGSKEVGAHLW